MFRAFLTLGRGLVQGLPGPSEDRDPIDLFRQWFDEADRAGLLLPEAMTVATATPDGRPSARTILLKQADHRGFVFFTNYESRKAMEIAQNPQVALVFHWGLLQRQVRVEGHAAPVERSESEAYFRTRPRGSRIGAWASAQSRTLDNRETLDRRVQEVERRFSGEEVPLPDFWGGYLVQPDVIEFWQGRPNRLHDRLVFTRSEGSWRTERLFP